MIAKIVPRSEDGGLLARTLEKWLALAKGARPKDVDSEDWTRVATVVSRLFLGDPAKAGASAPLPAVMDGG